mgnify:CR=1 FL=1
MQKIASLEFTEVHVPPVLAAQLPGRSGPDPASIGAAMCTAFASLMDFVQHHGLTVNGQPRAIYTAYGPEGVGFTVALPVALGPDTARTEDPSFRVEDLPSCKALRFTHQGPYPELAQTYNRITEFMKEKGWMQSEADWICYMPMWEEYLNDPETTPPAELRAYIYLPVPE